MVLKNIRSREEIKAAMSAALKEGNTEAYLNAFDEICDSIAQDIRAEFEQSRNEQDAKILAERGVRTNDQDLNHNDLPDPMKEKIAELERQIADLKKQIEELKGQ